jgi:hypothetical protein
MFISTFVTPELLVPPHSPGDPSRQRAPDFGSNKCNVNPSSDIEFTGVAAAAQRMRCLMAISAFKIFPTTVYY